MNQTAEEKELFRFPFLSSIVFYHLQIHAMECYSVVCLLLQKFILSYCLCTKTVVTSADASVAIKANPQLLPESTVSDNQHVTFPNHFKFSEAVKNGLTFGSIDASFGLATKYVNGTSGEINSVAAIEYSCGSDETAEESSTRLVNAELFLDALY